ncbi:MAG: MFS transporter [Coriobacteriales bacterium]|jgi:OFA family oxalate/formate antiporter-like MFS transporter|nr:MFS transporter [Coriobacteriales bacterium]
MSRTPTDADPDVSANGVSAKNVNDSDSIKKQRMLYLALATFALLILGLIYAWSIFASPIAREFPAYAGMLGQVFQVSMFAFCLSALFGAQLIKRSSPQLAIRVAALFVAAGFLLTAFAVDLGAWSLIAFYGILAASGCGIAYNAIITLVNAWFPDRIGFSSGVQMMGMGLASLVFGSLANVLFSIISWQAVFALIAGIAIIVLMALSFIVPSAPEGIEQLLSGAKDISRQPAVSTTRAQNILKTKVFWLYCVWAIIVIACGLTLIGSAKQGAEAIEPSFAYGALFVGTVSAVNGMGRLINGAIFDRFGLVAVMVMGALIAMIAASCLAIAFLALNLPLFLIGGLLVVFPYSGVPVMASAFARQRFGAKNFAKNLGIANLNASAAAVLNILIAAGLGPIGDRTNDALIYIILACLTIIAALSLLLFKNAYRHDMASIEEELVLR